jgi:hypothetical protein
MTARISAARWPVSGRQIPWKGVDQLVHVALFWPRWAVQCTPCQSFHLLAQVSRHSLPFLPSPSLVWPNSRWASNAGVNSLYIR